MLTDLEAVVSEVLLLSVLTTLSVIYSMAKLPVSPTSRSDYIQVRLHLIQTTSNTHYIQYRIHPIQTTFNTDYIQYRLQTGKK